LLKKDNKVNSSIDMTSFGTDKFVSSTLAGVLGTVAFGALFHAIGETGLMTEMIPALYGLGPSLTVGWIIHLLHGAVLGVIFAAAVSYSPYSNYLEDTTKSVGLGLGYGVITTVLLAAVLMPVWLGAVGVEAPSPPNFDPMGLIGHLIYGAVLGAAYPAIKEQLQ